ncbi:ABC-three component system middle component 6 [Bifidobacterium tibiigranuli]|jgi:hypothetical protein|uniref:ABC-three component system middle component 6 n=1 Tax=Bifidobacterium tibiigranuli TaxID=2172043 RepID=UPI00235670E1|nr:ABC-three component system middle component 6 [Bifidobacterium tibiigranuli]MCH3973701.1 hypothetical protein [Bifidobacterium tibiigranuli]
MLLPTDSRPEDTVYFASSKILHALTDTESKELPLAELFTSMKERHAMGSSFFFLCLDWLYLINAAKVDDRGMVSLCI